MRSETTTGWIVLVSVLLLGTASAAPVPTLNWGEEADSAECNSEQDPIVNAKRRVVNSLDSGFGADVWWGFIYHGGNCGTWENSVDEPGNGDGDIVCRQRGR